MQNIPFTEHFQPQKVVWSIYFSFIFSKKTYKTLNELRSPQCDCNRFGVKLTPRCKVAWKHSVHPRVKFHAFAENTLYVVNQAMITNTIGQSMVTHTIDQSMVTHTIDQSMVTHTIDHSMVTHTSDHSMVTHTID